MTKKQRTLADGYSFSEVLGHSKGTSRSNLIHWTNVNAIKADIQETAGTGHHRRFSLLNIIEVELCARVNAFGVPVKLLAEGVREFRQYHDLLAALTSAAPVDRANTTFTDAQQAVFVDLVSRHIVDVHKSKGIVKNNREARKELELLQKQFMEERGGDVDASYLKRAYAWERYRRDASFRQEHFVGLFLVPTITALDDTHGGPGGGHTTIDDDAVKPIDLNWAAYWSAIVVNIGAVLDQVETTTGAQL